MDTICYMCFCKSIFPTLDAFHSHKLCCEHFEKTPIKSVKSDSRALKAIPLSVIKENNVDSKQDVKINIVKSWTLFLDEEKKEKQSPEQVATNLWGRRLPRRTKVPYLSRAVPLSTDHSYERCPCGAVFVTRSGKRQHQARFCKFVKNKSRNLLSREPIIESANSVTELPTTSSEFIKNDDLNISKQIIPKNGPKKFTPDVSQTKLI